jgi:hypothetical protein
LPIGIRFGSFQPPPPTPTPGNVPPLISQGFLFAGFPFVPLTFDPPSEAANAPAGFVSVLGGQPVALTLTSLPFGGAYKSPQPNNFFLDPDPGTLTTQVFEDGVLDTTFAYRMIWSHTITNTEDPTGQFPNQTTQWRLEGTVTVDPTPVSINEKPEITGLSAAQGAATTQWVIAGDGPVTATVVAVDPDNGPDPLSYDWSQSDSRITPTGGTTSSTFIFDPSVLDEGVYGLNVQVSDGEDIVSGELIVRVLATDPATGTGDSDGDGIPDNVEGAGDTDEDGFPNFLDPIDGLMDPTRNRVDVLNPGLGDVLSDSGVLKLASTAFSTGRASFVVTEDDIAAFGGPGGTEGPDARDRINRVEGLGHSGGGIFDWRVDGIVPAGGVACVVLPQAEPLPDSPVYRKYNPRSSWREFSVGGGNALASTQLVGGVCPGPNDAAWDDNRGLVEGDTCIRVCVVDGGPNDTDVTVNGSVSDPGSVAANGAVPVSLKSSGCVLDTAEPASAGRHGEWWLLAGFIAWIGSMRKRWQRISLRK